MSFGLYAVPTDEETPYPVDWLRVEKALAAIGYDINPSRVHSTRVECDGVPFTITLDSNLRFLSMRTTWDPRIARGETEETLFALADSWNRERYFPTLYLQRSPSGSAEVIIDYLIDCRDGLTDAQLRDALRVGFQTGPDAVFYMQDAAVSLLGLHHDAPILPK